MNQRPRLAGITPWLGQTSNVWMHRQFDQLADQIGTVVTWEYPNRDQFPLPATDIVFVPEVFSQPLRGLPRTLDSFVGSKTGGSRFGSRFERWFRDRLVDAGVQGVLGQFGHYAMVAESALRRTSIPVFAHFHGHDLSARLSRKRYRTSLQSHWHDFAGHIVVATYQRDYLLSQGISDESIALIPCGAPTREIAQAVDSIRDWDASIDDHFTFLSVGRFVEKKDPMAVLRSFQACHNRHPSVSLRMGGDGPLHRSCQEWVNQQDKRFQGAVTFLGSLSPTEVVGELARASALVQHSRTASDGDKEGWPVSIAEAMAAGLPIIATRHAGIVDQVVESFNGLLCDEGDWRAMADDMLDLATEPERARSMGLRSRTRAFEFDSVGQIEKLRDFINHRIAVRSSGRQAA